MDQLKENLEKQAIRIFKTLAEDNISTISSSLNTDISNTEYNCLCSQLPKVTNLSQCAVTIESGIGSSISSIDANAGLNVLSSDVTTASNISHSKYDCHELPPVSEEEDFSDGIISIIHSNDHEENAHLNNLPWHDDSVINCSHVNYCVNKEDAVCKSDHMCKTWCDQKNVHDDMCIMLIHEEAHSHLPNPWQCEELVSTAVQPPILSPMCYENNSMLVRSDSCQRESSHYCHNWFHRRHSMQNSSSIIYQFNKNHVCWHNRANIFDEDNDDGAILSRAAERVIEWLKLMSIENSNEFSNNNHSLTLLNTFQNDRIDNNSKSTDDIL